jgi:hypothetical protein
MKQRALPIALFAILAFAGQSRCDTWGGAEVKSVRLYNERTLSFNVTTMQCSGAPCSATLNFVVEANPSNWPSHTTGDVKAFQALLLTAMSTGRKINVDFSWNGYVMPGTTGGGYFMNWVEMPN